MLTSCEPLAKLGVLLSIHKYHSGFKATCIYPFNPNALPDAAFAPSDVSVPSPQILPPCIQVPDKVSDTHSETQVEPIAPSPIAPPISLSSPNANTESIAATPLQEISSDHFLQVIYDIGIPNNSAITSTSITEVVDLPLTLDSTNSLDAVSNTPDDSITVVSDKKIPFCRRRKSQ